MNEVKSRRGFLKALGAGTLGAAMMVGSGQETQGNPRKKRFKGTSRKGDIEEALQNAIAAAERSVPHPDAMVEWTLVEVRGRVGGIAGFHEITVTIEALVS